MCSKPTRSSAPHPLLRLARASRDGALVVSEVVWAEVLTAYQPPEGVLEDLAAFGVRFDPMQPAAAQLAAGAWALYRAAGGRYRGHFGALVVASPKELLRTTQSHFQPIQQSTCTRPDPASAAPAPGCRRPPPPAPLLA